MFEIWENAEIGDMTEVRTEIDLSSTKTGICTYDAKRKRKMSERIKRTP